MFPVLLPFGNNGNQGSWKPDFSQQVHTVHIGNNDSFKTIQIEFLASEHSLEALNLVPRVLVLAPRYGELLLFP